jgi:hypothetical protein
MQFKEIPITWLVGGLGICLVGLRALSIDSWTTAALSSVMGYILGAHIATNTPITSQSSQDRDVSSPQTLPSVVTSENNSLV